MIEGVVYYDIENDLQHSFYCKERNELIGQLLQKKIKELKNQKKRRKKDTTVIQWSNKYGPLQQMLFEKV
jgi:metal-responsive CopG/Arc/MetJ family transcriptional regulator